MNTKAGKIAGGVALASGAMIGAKSYMIIKEIKR